MGKAGRRLVARVSDESTVASACSEQVPGRDDGSGEGIKGGDGSSEKGGDGGAFGETTGEDAEGRADVGQGVSRSAGFKQKGEVVVVACGGFATNVGTVVTCLGGGRCVVQILGGYERAGERVTVESDELVRAKRSSWAKRRGRSRRGPT